MGLTVKQLHHGANSLWEVAIVSRGEARCFTILDTRDYEYRLLTGESAASARSALDYSIHDALLLLQALARKP